MNGKPMRDAGADRQRAANQPGNIAPGRCDGSWGDEPMTDTQASSLRALSIQALEYDAFDPALTRAEASRRIDALKAKLALLGEPPHTL